MRIRALFIMMAATLILPSSQAGLPEIVYQVKPSIVGIGTLQPTRRPPAVFVGTGFVVGDGRHVLTNAHNISRKLGTARKESLAVFTAGASNHLRRARVAALDEVHDLALLQVEGKSLPAIVLGDSEKVREGELYAFTGFPIGMALGMQPVTHRGIVSAITSIANPTVSAQQLSLEMIKRLNARYAVFQLDATAYPGNSGSPLYNPQTGKVIGIVNMVFVKKTKEHLLSDPSGISYAIPIEHAKALLKRAGLPTDKDGSRQIVHDK